MQHNMLYTLTDVSILKVKENYVHTILAFPREGIFCKLIANDGKEVSNTLSNSQSTLRIT